MQSIPNGIEGIRDTLKIMSKLVKQYKNHPVIRELAVSLTNGLLQKDFKREIAVIHQFVRDKIRYVKDINGTETIHTPVQILRLRAGDCDDKSILVAALLESIGHPTRFLAVGFKPNHYSHVFTETKVRDKWVAVECTEPVSVGWRPRNIKAVMIQHNREKPK